MPLPRHLLRAETFRADPFMVALAAVAVGMFVGAWVIGPAISYGTEPKLQTVPQEQQGRLTYQAMLARPDPSPYRTGTPDFGNYPSPHNAAVAKAKAQAETGGRTASESYSDQAEQSFSGDQDDGMTGQEPAAPRTSYSRARYPKFDRHQIY